MGVIICGPTRLARRFKANCEDCLRKTYWLNRFDGVCYGFTERCMACGATWQDGIKLRVSDGAYWRGLWNQALPAKEFEATIQKVYNEAWAD